MTRYVAALAAALCAMALVAGCSNCSGPDDDGDAGYPLRTSPAKVAAKLVEAYEAMDAEAYKDCLADTFTFWPHELYLPEQWDLETESDIADSMFGAHTNIIALTLSMTRYDPAGEGRTSATVSGDSLIVYSYRLSVYLPGDLTLWANNFVHLRFSVDPETRGPAGETLWQIARCEDDRSPEFAGHAVEDTTWGSIKNQYR